MKKDEKLIAKKLIKILKGSGNIEQYTYCSTRIVVMLKNNSISFEDIKKINGVIDVEQTSYEVQIILEPSKVKIVAEEIFHNYPEIKFFESLDKNSSIDKVKYLSNISKINKEKQKIKNTSNIHFFLSKFSNIFAPLIFGFIGVGILSGVGGILQSSYMILNPLDKTKTVWINITAKSWFLFLNILLNAWKVGFIIIIGWRTASVFGGVGVVGAIASLLFVPSFASIYTAPFINDGVGGLYFLGIHIKNPLKNWLTIGFRPSINDNGMVILNYSSGGIFGAIFASLISIPIVKEIKKYTPDVMDIVLSSTITFIVLLFLSYGLIIPISGVLFDFVSIMFKKLSRNPGGAMILAGVFLIAVVFGVHQGFAPIYLALLGSTGINSLFPILAMGGAGQVGVAIALFFKADKNSKIRKQIKGAIIPAFLGIGEPLIYCITLPRPKTFLASMMGASIGGLFLGFLSFNANIIVGLNTVFGPSGILASPMMIAKKGGTNGHVLDAISSYLSALLISYTSGFIFTHIIGTKGVDLS